jgi:hypothetical protein
MAVLFHHFDNGNAHSCNGIPTKYELCREVSESRELVPEWKHRHLLKAQLERSISAVELLPSPPAIQSTAPGAFRTLFPDNRGYGLVMREECPEVLQRRLTAKLFSRYLEL